MLVKTDIGAASEALQQVFQPRADIPATNTQQAIELVAAGLAGAGAPGDGEYIVGSPSGELSDERVATDTATINVDLDTPGQALWHVLELPGIDAAGMAARTGAGNYEARTITGTADEITISNGDGVAGNPTISLPTNIILTNKNIDGVEKLGVNTTADTTNRLSVNSDAVLFNHNGTTSQVKVNKAATGDTASHLFQVGFSGRAEFGLIADNDFTLKTSPDGSAFTTALIADNATGAIRVPVNLRPSANDGAALGSATVGWADAFFASGGVVNWNNGDVTITHAANTLTFAGATTTGYQFQDGPIRPVADDGVSLGISGTAFADLFLATGGVVNWNSGDVTITHAAGSLTVAGATAVSLGTAAALTTGTIELGAATDTTLSRVSAGVVAIEGANILTAATGQPLNSNLTELAALRSVAVIHAFNFQNYR